MSRGRPFAIPEERILDAALDVFLERGLDATIEDVAGHASISEGAVFHRYKTKEALLLAVFEREILSLHNFGELESRAGKGAIEDHLFELATSVIAKARRLFPLLMLAFGSPINLSELRSRGIPAQDQLIRFLTRYFELEVRLGRIERTDCEILARIFSGGVHQYVMTELFEGGGPLPLPEVTFLRGMIHILLHGVTRRSPAGATRGLRTKT